MPAINYDSHVHTVIYSDKYASSRYLQDALRQAYAKFLAKIVIPYNEAYLTDYLLDIENLRKRVTAEKVLANPHQEMTVLWSVRRCGTELCIMDQHEFAVSDLERYRLCSDSKMTQSIMTDADWYPCVLTVQWVAARDSFLIQLTQCFAEVPVEYGVPSCC